MTQPTTCCCHSPDPHECALMRLGVAVDEDGELLDDDDACNCHCHSFENGENGWGVQLEEFEL